MDKKVITTNRKAFHDYTIFEKFVAGIVLTGTEIKSIRKNAINLKDSFCKIEDNEIFLYNCHISPYEQGNRYNHEAERTRKLLLTKKEILKMHSKIKKDLNEGIYKRVLLVATGALFSPTFVYQKKPILSIAHLVCLEAI